MLDGLYPDLKARGRAMTVREIQEQTAEAFGISVEALVSPSRAGGLAWPRQVAMYLARELTDQTLPAIGRAFGGRNHTTVLHAYKRTAERIAGDPRRVRDRPAPHPGAPRPRLTVMTPPRLTDFPTPVHRRRTASEPQLCSFLRRVVHTINTPYDGDLNLSNRPNRM